MDKQKAFTPQNNEDSRFDCGPDFYRSLEVDGVKQILQQLAVARL